MHTLCAPFFFLLPCGGIVHTITHTQEGRDCGKDSSAMSWFVVAVAVRSTRVLCYNVERQRRDARACKVGLLCDQHPHIAQQFTTHSMHRVRWDPYLLPGCLPPTCTHACS